MNGFLNVLKPPGMSSAQTVGVIKRLLGVKKAGHTGTLDPAAAGVLPVCLGRATKFSDYVMATDKEYIAEITFGIKTDTMDSVGKSVERDNKSAVSKDSLENVLLEFNGKIVQTVPIYSAVKQNGLPLYKAAVKKQEASLPKREVNIKSIEILSDEKNRYLMKIICSKGTYIRSLIEALGDRLNTCAYTSFLLRTGSGNFKIDQSYTIDEIKECSDIRQLLIPVDKALNDMPTLHLKDYLFDIITTGSAVDLRRAGLNAADSINYRVFCRNEFLGVGKTKENSLKLNAYYYLRGSK